MLKLSSGEPAASSRRMVAAYAVAAVTLILVSLLHWAVSPYLPRGGTYLIFMVPVIAGGWFGGFAPGLFATVAGALLVSFFFFEPVGSLVLTDPADYVRSGLFLLIGTVVSFLTGTLHQSREEAVSTALALKEREERFRILADAAPVLIWMSDADGGCSFVNKQWLRFTGRSVEQERGDGWTHSVHPDDLQGCLATYRSSFATQTPFTREFRLRRADGEYRWIVDEGVPRFSTTGAFEGFIGSCLDITDRRLAEEARRESDQHLRFAMESARMGSWEWNIRTGALSWSENLEPLHGLAPGTFEGTFEGFMRLVHPEDREALSATIQTTMESGSRYDTEFRVVWPDGTIRWIRGLGQVFSGADGKPERMVGLGMDVTERKEAEGASSLLAAIVESSHDAILTKSLDGRITSWNEGARQLYGYEAHEVIGRPVSLLTPNELQQDLDEVIRAIRRGEQESIETERVRKDGRRIYVSLTVSPVRDRSGRLTGASTIARDITERKRLEAELQAKNEQLQTQAEEMAAQYEEMQLQNEELAEQDRQRNEFLAMLGHELRNPLAPIATAMEVLRLRGGANPPAQRQYEIIDRQARHLARLVDDLLDASRITQGKVVLQKEPVELSDAVEQGVQICSALMDERRHTLTVQLPREPLLLEADPTRLVQIICNLLNNAAKYTEPGGTIQVAAALERTHAVIRVRDNGRGIPPETLPRIFDLFVQGERSLARTEGGLGVGLTLVRRLAELHGGTVEAFSEGVGKGSEFVVRLPVIPQASRSSSGAQQRDAEVGPASPRKILIIDDNADSNATLSELIGLWGHEVRTALDGVRGLRMAQEFRPDIILLDIGLPGSSGYEVLTHLRREPALTATRIVAVSGYGQPTDRQRSLRAGFEQHLVKPVEAATLREVIERSPGG